MDRKWVESRHPEVYFEGPLAISERDALRLDSFQYGVKTSRDGGNSGDSKGGGGKDGGDGGGGGGGGGGDKDKSSNKSQDDKSNDNGDGGNNNNNNDNNNNSSKSQGDSTTTGIVTVTTALLLPPLAVPISSPVTPSLALTTTSTTSLTTSTTSVISVIETTSIVTSVQMATMTTIIPVVTILPTVQISSQPRKGVDGPGADPTSPFPVFGSPTSVDTIVSTATDVAATVTASAIADSDGSGNNTSGNNNKGSGGHSGKKDSDKNQPPGALDPAAEHALIAVGSIGKLRTRHATMIISNPLCRCIRSDLLRRLDGLSYLQKVETRSVLQWWEFRIHQ